MSGKGDMFSYFGKKKEAGKDILDIKLSEYMRDSNLGKYGDDNRTFYANKVDIERESVKTAANRLSEMGISPKSGNLRTSSFQIKKKEAVNGSVGRELITNAITVYDYTNPNVSDKMVKVAVAYNRSNSPVCTASKVLLDGNNKKIEASTKSELKKWYYSPKNTPIDEKFSPKLAIYNDDKYCELNVSDRDRAIARLKVAGIELQNRASGEGLDRPFIEICAYDKVDRDRVSQILSTKEDEIDIDKINVEYLEKEEMELEKIETRLGQLYDDATKIEDSIDKAMANGELTNSEKLLVEKKKINAELKEKESRRKALNESIKNHKAQVQTSGKTAEDKILEYYWKKTGTFPDETVGITVKDAISEFIDPQKLYFILSEGGDKAEHNSRIIMGDSSVESIELLKEAVYKILKQEKNMDENGERKAQVEDVVDADESVDADEETREVVVDKDDEFVPDDKSVVSPDEDADLPVEHLREDMEPAPEVEEPAQEETNEENTNQVTDSKKESTNNLTASKKRVKIAIKDNTFAHACVEQNSIQELKESLNGKPDQEDMKEWDLTESEWRNQIEQAIKYMEDNKRTASNKWFSIAQVAKICPQCAADMRKKGLKKVKASLFTAQRTKSNDSERYQNPDDSFKKMTTPGGTDKESKFGGCVRYMMSDEGGNHTEESAKNICGSIAQKKGRKAQLAQFEIGDRVLVKPLSRTGEIIDIKQIEDSKETVYEVSLDGVADPKLVSESAVELVEGTSSAVEVAEPGLENFPATVGNDTVQLGAVAHSRAPSFYREAKKAAEKAARKARTQAESIGDYDERYDVKNLGSGLYRPIRTAENIVRDMRYNKFPTYEDAFANYCSEWPEEPSNEVKKVLARLDVNLK